ncbi:MAG: N-acetylmuramoyl-L-alanine amidase [Chitinophagales bacterium]|nr:N-acetylmuramoyl-L-alanine amidase [Bacteroidota bacterium]
MNIKRQMHLFNRYDKIIYYAMSFKSMFKTSKIRIACLILIFSVHSISFCAGTANNFKLKTIVLDAGHGGHDSGCHGYAGSYEKDVTLKVILALGKIIEQKYPDIKVLYSRKTDVFITLQDRALLANKNNADLFISVHCNANNNKAAYGTETFFMGMHVTDENLAVAKRENDVIKLESNYKQTYGDFDPDSPESMIALSLAQNANIEQSSFLATRVQDYLTNSLNRYDRGVKQAGFWVLYRTTCPSILIETGFLTNKNEEKFLTSDDGQDKLANAIFHAFEDYKNMMEKDIKFTPVVKNTSVNVDSEKTTPKEIMPNEEIKTTPIVKTNAVAPKNGIIYKVQILTTSQKLSTNNKAYKLYKNLTYERSKNLYRYAYSPFTDLDLAKKVLKLAQKNGYPDAFIVVEKNGEKLSPSEAKKYIQ